MKVNRKLVEGEQAMSQFIENMAKDSLMLITAYCEKVIKDESVLRFYATHFVSLYLQCLIPQMLNVQEGVTNKAVRASIVLSNFKMIKLEIQRQVADAFDQVMLLAPGGEPVNHYCEIKIIPDAVNKQPC